MTKIRKTKTKRTKFSSGKNAWAICDRTGFRHPYTEMVTEPGTGLFVHYSVSDGEYNTVDHPQNFPDVGTENTGLEHPSPDRVEPSVLKKDGNGVPETDANGYLIYVTEDGTEVSSRMKYVE